MGSETFEGYVRVSEILAYFGRLGKCEECLKNKAGIDEVILANKCEIGTEVHELIEMYIHGVDYPSTEKSRGYFESFKKWYNKKKPKIVASEKRLFLEKLKITGQIDLIADFGVGNCIVDFKTSYSPDLNSWLLQASLYYLLAEQKSFNHSIIDVSKFVHLKKNGSIAEEFDFYICIDKINLAMSYYEVFKNQHKEKFDVR